MTWVKRLKGAMRDRRHRREARLAIAKAQRAVDRRRRPNPGYDELKDPWFIGVMCVAVVALVLDLRPELETSPLAAWFREAIEILKGYV